MIYGLVYVYDKQRHLVCVPYSVANLWNMADDLGIKDCWFHRDHFDIPLGMMEKIEKVATRVSTRDILRIITRNGRIPRKPRTTKKVS